MYVKYIVCACMFLCTHKRVHTHTHTSVCMCVCVKGDAKALRSAVVAALLLPHHHENHDDAADANHDRDDDDGSQESTHQTRSSADGSADGFSDISAFHIRATRFSALGILCTGCTPH